MDIWDEAKHAANLAKHGLDFAGAQGFEWETALTAVADRSSYDETRFISIGFLGARLHVLVWTEREGNRRLISLRKANPREIKRYARQI